MKKLSLLALCAITMLAACGSKEVPLDIVDSNQTISRLNAQKNADAFFPVLYPPETADAKLGKPIRILMDSDSTISKNCRYGDGWASGYINFDSGKKLKVICQTNGAGKGVNGCLTEGEFVTKPYKGEDKVCSSSITSLEKR